MMKNLFTLFILLFSAAMMGQVVPCYLTGPGSADGGTDPVACGTTANYSFQNSNTGGVCNPTTDGQPWSWCIDTNGNPGWINLSANTSYPVNFTMGNGVSGSIVGASAVSITIRWDCDDCSECTVDHINVMFGCAEEIYQISIFVECTGNCGPPIPTCSVDVLDCVSTDCECTQICINGVIYQVTNESGEEVIFCLEGGIEIDGAAPCGTYLPCNNDPDTGKGGKRNGGSLEDAPNLIEIPAVNVRAISKESGNVNIELQLPESDRDYELVVFDSAGRTIQANTVSNNQASISLNGLMPGVYFVTITDGNTVITHKVFVK